MDTKDKTIIDTAIRETKEEIGIMIDKSKLKYGGKIHYINGKKSVIYYTCTVKDDEIPDVIPKSNLQIEEIDEARFVDINEAKKLISKNLVDIINNINNK